MPKTTARPYSGYTKEALSLMAASIKVARLESGMTANELAERACISRGLLKRIESGDPACGIGTVFEVAALLRIPLFQSDHADLAFRNKVIRDKLALLPRRIRKPKVEINDDF